MPIVRRTLASLKKIARANEGEIYQARTEIFGDVFMRDDLVLTPELSANDVRGWDSMKQIEILLARFNH